MKGLTANIIKALRDVVFDDKVSDDIAFYLKSDDAEAVHATLRDAIENYFKLTKREN